MHTQLLVLWEETTNIANGRSFSPSRGLYSKPVSSYSRELSYSMAFPLHHMDTTLNLWQGNQKLWSEWCTLERNGKQKCSLRDASPLAQGAPAASHWAPPWATKACHHIPAACSSARPEPSKAGLLPKEQWCCWKRSSAPGQFPFQRETSLPESPVCYRAAELCCDLIGTPLQNRPGGELGCCGKAVAGEKQEKWRRWCQLKQGIYLDMHYLCCFYAVVQ